MKILQIFGAVIAVHLLAFIFIFASPGCQSNSRPMPTPDATMQTSTVAPVTFNTSYTAQPVAESSPAADLGTGGSVATYVPSATPGRATPTRPGSPNAAAIVPQKSTVENVAPVTTYTVQKGDSLWSIAKRNNMSVSELARANSLGSSATLQPGKKLIVPVQPGAAKPADLATTTAATSTQRAAAARPANGESVKHTVQAGESLGIISQKYQITVGELAAANNITDPSKVRAGQQLVIPGFKAVGSKSSSNRSAPAESMAAESANQAPRFELKAPPPGQDLDAGLSAAESAVPTIKVEEPKKDAVPPKL